jgi:hypothetical protein
MQQMCSIAAPASRLPQTRASPEPPNLTAPPPHTALGQAQPAGAGLRTTLAPARRSMAQCGPTRGKMLRRGAIGCSLPLSSASTLLPCGFFLAQGLVERLTNIKLHGCAGFLAQLLERSYLPGLQVTNYCYFLRYGHYPPIVPYITKALPW